MSQTISVQCPNCQARLKLKDRSSIGREIACPKCKAAFIARQAPGSHAAGSVQSRQRTAAGRSAAHDAAPLPRRSGRRKARPRDPQTTPVWQRPPLLIGGGVAAVALLVGVILVATGAFSGSDEIPAPAAAQAAGPQGASASDHGSPSAAETATTALDTAFLPPDAELFVAVRPADVWNAPLLKPLLDSPETQQQLASFEQATGLNPSDVESVLVGIADVSDKLGETAAAGLSGAAGAADPLEWADADLSLVARTRQPIAIDRLIAWLPSQAPPGMAIERQQHGDHTWFRLPGPVPEQSGGMFLADERTLVLCPEAAVVSRIAAG